MCSEPRPPSPPASIPPGVALLLEDFPERLEAVRDLFGLNSEEMAVALGVDPRQLLRWRIKGGAPNGGAMLSLVRGWRYGRRRVWRSCWARTSS